MNQHRVWENEKSVAKLTIENMLQPVVCECELIPAGHVLGARLVNVCSF